MILSIEIVSTASGDPALSNAIRKSSEYVTPKEVRTSKSPDQAPGVRRHLLSNSSSSSLSKDVLGPQSSSTPIEG